MWVWKTSPTQFPKSCCRLSTSLISAFYPGSDNTTFWPPSHAIRFHSQTKMALETFVIMTDSRLLESFGIEAKFSWVSENSMTLRTGLHMGSSLTKGGNCTKRRACPDRFLWSDIQQGADIYNPIVKTFVSGIHHVTCPEWWDLLYWDFSYFFPVILTWEPMEVSDFPSPSTLGAA